MTTAKAKLSELAIVRFAGHLRTSPRDREALLALIGDGEEASVIADFARRRGYAVTPAEVVAFFAAVEPDEVDASPIEIDPVSGGLHNDFLKRLSALLERGSMPSSNARRN